MLSLMANHDDREAGGIVFPCWLREDPQPGPPLVARHMDSDALCAKRSGITILLKDRRRLTPRLINSLYRNPDNPAGLSSGFLNRCSPSCPVSCSSVSSRNSAVFDKY